MLSTLLREHDWVLADGATGTVFMDRGLGPGEAPELWNEEQSERVLERHREFVDAGARLLLTNSFGGNRHRLALHGRGADARSLSETAAKLARITADECAEPVVVAGSMGPTGELLEPVGSLSLADAVRSYVEQAEGLMAGGSDVLWGETLSAREEVIAVATAAAEVGAPYCITMSFDTAGRTMMGVRPSDFVELCGELPVPPVAIGANCGTGASDLLASLLEILPSKTELPLIAKANAGVPQLIGGEIRYDGTPELMARFACLARDAGARIIGGCCGTTPEHIAAMGQALSTSDPADPPTHAEVEASTGPFAQISGEPAPKRRSRRRR